MKYIFIKRIFYTNNLWKNSRFFPFSISISDASSMLKRPPQIQPRSLDGKLHPDSAAIASLSVWHYPDSYLASLGKGQLIPDSDFEFLRNSKIKNPIVETPFIPRRLQRRLNGGFGNDNQPQHHRHQRLRAAAERRVTGWLMWRL